jgi:hypothetical protein
MGGGRRATWPLCGAGATSDGGQEMRDLALVRGGEDGARSGPGEHIAERAGIAAGDTQLGPCAGVARMELVPDLASTSQSERGLRRAGRDCGGRIAAFATSGRRAGGDCSCRDGWAAGRRGLRRAGVRIAAVAAGRRGREAGAVYDTLLIVSRDCSHIYTGTTTLTFI